MRSLLAAPFALASLLACSSPSDPPPGGSCPAPTKGPTTHAGTTLSADTTWAADASPHVVTGDVSVAAAATLTLEPCATVTIGQDHLLNVYGKLVAAGTAAKPIKISQTDAGKRWASIDIRDPGSARLSYVTIDGGGGLPNSTAGVALRVRGTAVVPIVKPLFVDHVTVNDSAGPGVSLSETAGFADGSQELVITKAGQAPNATALSGPYPLRINPNAVGTIPSGKYTGNASDQILLVGDAPSYALAVSATLKNLGVPYEIGGTNGGNTEFRVSDDKGGLATLTIEAGVELRFEKDARFEIGHFTGNQPPIGALVAVGTQDKPIILTSASATPVAGDWAGLRFVNTLSATNRVEFVKVRYAGGPCGCSSFSCGPTIRPGVTDDAAILLFNVAPGNFIKNTAIEDSSSHGIGRGWTGADTPSFLADGNTFANVAGCNETTPRPTTGGCPNPPPCPK